MATLRMRVKSLRAQRFDVLWEEKVDLIKDSHMIFLKEMKMSRLREGNLYISCGCKLELRYAPLMECQKGGIFEKWRYHVIDREFAGPGLHNIPESTHWNHVFIWDRRNHPLRESYTLTSGGGVQLQVQNQGWK